MNTSPVLKERVISAIKFPEHALLLKMSAHEKSTPFQIDSEKECLECFWKLISIQLRAGRDVIIHH
jgi:hypothetical protein